MNTPPSLQALCIITVCEQASNRIEINYLQIPRLLRVTIKEMWDEIYLTKNYWFKELHEDEFYEIDFDERLTRSQYLSITNYEDDDDGPYFWFNEEERIYCVLDFFTIEQNSPRINTRRIQKFCKQCYHAYTISPSCSFESNEYWRRTTQHFCIKPHHSENQINIFRTFLIRRQYWCECCTTRSLITFHDNNNIFYKLLSL